MLTKNLGGDRLGSGNKMNVAMHGYQRSTHDLSYLWKSTMSVGTLVPFMNILALPGDTFDINLDSVVKTHPTIGPLFGSMKLQLDVFSCPIRLYNRFLHNNKLNVGLNMSTIKFPQITISGDNIDENSTIPPEFQQINQSCILAYLGLRGVGGKATDGTGIQTTKNAIPYIAYWDIFKNYYANKSEPNAYVIHGKLPEISTASYNGDSIMPGEPNVPVNNRSALWIFEGYNISLTNIEVEFTSLGWTKIIDFYDRLTPNSYEWIIPGQVLHILRVMDYVVGDTITDIKISGEQNDIRPGLTSFPLDHIDTVREAILAQPAGVPFPIFSGSITPFNLAVTLMPEETHKMYATFAQEGLAVKTYQSDIFNNWVQTDWIEGAGSISEITKISTAGGGFTLDTLNISKKVYDLLNRIAVSGGSYEDYIEATYDHKGNWRPETPVYLGGLSKEIVFQEVVSQSATIDEPLGSLAGKGTMSQKHKGGYIVANIDEPSFIIGIVSITPRISYSQGNDWTTNLKTLDDLHKPALDGIGFQDLVTDQLAFWDTQYTGGVPTYKSAGKQPAWLNYMTGFDKNFGNFADPRSQQFMTLDRKYTMDEFAIKDLTTYIDPAKFNYAFAQTDLSAMNFWVQIANNITARRKMSAKIIPNL